MVIIIKLVSDPGPGLGWCFHMKYEGEKPRILLTRKLPDKGMSRLRSDAHLDLWEEDDAIPREEMLKRASECDALICLLSETIDGEIMNTGIKAIGNYAVGYDNIDIGEATSRGIPVFNTPGVLTDATADIAMSLLLAAARRLVEADSYIREGRFTGWSPELFLGKDLKGSRLGVIGAGKIGGAVLKRAKGFGMELTYNSRERKPQLEKETGATYCDLDDILKRSDFVSLNVPLTDETHHLIGRKELKMMKNDSILINTSRGPVVDEGELYSALVNGEIMAAGLDVFEEEPKVYPPLLELKNVVMLPHLGSATVNTRTRMAEMVIDDVINYLKDKDVENCVNPSALG